jgi:hypothetical protein
VAAQSNSRSFRSSTKRTQNFFRRLLGLQEHRSHAQLNPDDLPAGQAGLEEGYEGNMFGLGRGFAAKAANEPRLRCTELDGNGTVTLVSGEFKKSELIAKVCTNFFLDKLRCWYGICVKFFLVDFSMDSCLEISGRSTPPYCRTYSFDTVQFSSVFSTYES